MPLQRDQLPPRPSSGDARSRDTAGEASAAAIRLIFLDPDRSSMDSRPATALRFRTESVTQLGDAVAELDTQRPDLVLLHHCAAIQSALATLRRHDRQLPIIVVIPAGEQSHEVIIATIRAGATDVISGATPEDRVREKITAALERRQLQKRPSVRIHAAVATELRAGGGASVDAAIVGMCDAMIGVSCSVARSAGGHFPLLIHGEPGTGKSLTALSVHRHGPGAAESPHVIDCGHCRAEWIDPFLFAAPDGSVGLHPQHQGKTLIIENVDHATTRTQRRLLAAIGPQARQAPDTVADSPRLVMTCSTAIAPVPVGPASAAGTGSSPGGLIDELYFELSAHAIELPPLRQRGNDIEMLIDHFVRLLTGTEPVDRSDGDHRITKAAKAALLAYRWPGNVTQLRSVVLSELRLGDGAIVLSERLTSLIPDRSPAPAPITALAEQPRVPEHLVTTQPIAVEPTLAPQRRLPELSSPQAWSSSIEQCMRDSSRGDDNASLYGDAIQAVETGLINAVLAKTGGNLAQSARLLGITRVSLRRKIHSLGLQIPGRPPLP